MFGENTIQRDERSWLLPLEDSLKSLGVQAGGSSPVHLSSSQAAFCPQTFSFNLKEVGSAFLPEGNTQVFNLHTCNQNAIL